jgi:acyl-CoA synthetase (AMP-forming)/AMP-acid ligase II
VTGTTLGAMLRGDGDRLAVADSADTGRLTFAQLQETSDRIGRQLSGIGTGPGDTVAMAFPNGPEIVALFLGVLGAGAGAAPLNPGYTRREFRAYLADLRPSAMLLPARDASQARGACGELGIRTLAVESEGLDSPRLQGVPAAGELAPADPEATALILHTSGTTGAPKGVYLRQRHLVASTRTIAACYGLGAQDVSYCVMPLFHVHGLLASALAPLVAGGTVVVSSRFSASAFWREVASWGATWFSAVPTIHRTLVGREGEGPRRPSNALRFARSCSAALPTPLWREFEQRFELPLVEAYGMTEASHQMCSNPLPPGERRPGTVGPPTGIELAILDDDWHPLPPGESGEVAVHGPSVVDGYRGNPEATASSFREGWYRTGDRGRLSDDGYLSLEGRIKELINRGGEKISPQEVEDALLEHPRVAEAVAFAIADEKYGEVVAAVVVPQAGNPIDVDQVRDHCAERLASFKVPGWIEVADAIPKGPTGKVQRRQMAALIRR